MIRDARGAMWTELSDRIRDIEHDTEHLPTDTCSVHGFIADALAKNQTRAICALSRVLLALPDHVDSGRADRKLDLILARLDALGRQETTIMKELDDLTTQVQATDDAQQSALTLINGIADRLAAAGTDPAKLQALTESLKTNSDALAAAVIANTPAAS
jgi:hypothetical protein